MLISRRDFLVQSALAGAVVIDPPRFVWPSDRIRVGVVGLDRGGRMHLAEYARVPGIAIAALCDIDGGRARAAAAALQSAGAARPALYADFRRMVDDAGLDVVSIATPREHHVDMIITAVEASKAVMVEPPCCIDVLGSDRLARALLHAPRPVQQRTSGRFVAATARPAAIRGPFSRVAIVRQASGDASGAAASMWDCLEEFDFARALMPFAPSVTVSAVGLRHQARGRFRRIAACFHYGEGADQPRLEISVAPEHPPGSTLRFQSREGTFEVRSVPLGPASETTTAAYDLIARMRDGRHDLLLAPVSEMRLACSMACLASDAVEMGRSRSSTALTTVA
jgi:predicted dehydrogenase